MALAIALLLAAAPASDVQVVLDRLRAYDETVGNIGYELARAGVALCPASVVPLAGLRIHTVGQYGKGVQADARALFGLGDYPAILTLSNDSAAARAGMKAGDWIMAINGTDLRSGPGYGGVARFEEMLAAALTHPPATLVIERDGIRKSISLTGLPGCASRVELIPGKRLNAVTRVGDIVQVTTALVEETQSEDELAFVIAHEMAHNINDAAGRPQGRNKAVEIEADRLGLRLMRAAGYDLMAAARFWTRFGKKTGAGIFSDGSHLRTKDRVRLLAAEAQKLAQ